MVNGKAPPLLALVSCTTALLLTALPAPAARGGKGGNRDRKAPTIVISSPAEGQEVRDPTVTVTGSVTDDASVQSAEIVVNGGEATPLLLDGGGGFSRAVYLRPGGNVIEVVAADVSGNRSSVSRNVTLLGPPSAVRIMSPKEGDVIGAGIVDIVGELLPPATSLSVHPGLRWKAESGPFYIPGFGLAEGPNTVTVTGYDDEGNAYPASVTVECTSTGEPLALRTDVPGGISPLTVTFTLENFTGETLTGWEVDPEGDGTFAAAPSGVDGLTHTYEIGRFHEPEVRAVTSSGHHFSASAVVSVHGPAHFAGSFPAEDPVDLAVDGKGRLYVLEGAPARVRVFDGDENEIAVLGGHGTLSEPSGIGVDGDGTVFVSDAGGDRVVKFSPSFSYLGSWGHSGSKFGEIRAPRGIDAAHDGGLVIADTGNGRIDWYSGDGYFQGAFKGELIEPWDVTWAGGGRVAAADRRGSAQILSAGSSAALWRSAPGEFSSPAGLSWDAGTGLLALADEAAGTVTLLKVRGHEVTFVRRIDALEGDDIGLLRPLAAVRRASPVEDIFYIADNGHGRVVKVMLSRGPDTDPVAVWTDVREALAAGDAEAALGHFSVWTQEMYRQAFTAGAGRLGEIAADMAEIHPLEVTPLRAVYGVLREEDGKPFLYHVVFARDEAGAAWKILHW